jgi:hypothetical protein
MIRIFSANSPKVLDKIPAKGSPRNLNALVLGIGGRLGQELGPEMLDRGMTVFSNTREIGKAPVGAIAKVLAENKIDVIVNAAVVSEGSRESMQEVNVELPVRVAQAALSADIPFIQISSTATQVSGIDASQTPYAHSKLEAENRLGVLPNVKTGRLDALVGGGKVKGKIDITYMSKAGIAVHFKGISPTFQPTSYKAVSVGLANMALACTDSALMTTVPDVVNFVGNPISVSDFVRHLDQKALELHVDPATLLGLAAAVENGSLTPEFLHLAISSGKDPKIHCTADFMRFLGSEKLPTVEDLVKDIRDQCCPLLFMQSSLDIIRKVPDKVRLVREVAKFAISTAKSLGDTAEIRW